MPVSKKNLSMLIFMLLLLSLPSFAQEGYSEYAQPPSQYDRYTDFLKQLNAIQDRGENRPGAQHTLDLLIQYAQDKNIAWSLYNIEQRGEFHSFGKNLSLFIPGEEEGRIVFFVPYISSNEGSNTGIIAALLSILDNAKPRSHIEICFLGSVDENKGVREYLNRIRVLTPDALFYLTSHNELGASISVENGDRRRITPLQTLTQLKELQVKHGVSAEHLRTQLYRIGLQSPHDIATLLNSGLNAAGITFPANSQATIVGKPSLTFLFDLVHKTGSEVQVRSNDLHYISPVLLAEQFFITESQYILSILGILLVSLLAFVLIRKKRRKYARLILNSIPAIIFSVAAMAISLLIGHGLIRVLEAIRNIDTLSVYSPLLLLFLQMTGVLAFFTGFTVIFNRIYRIVLSNEDGMRSNSAAYTIGSLVFSGLSLVVFSILDINFSHYFLWIFLWTWIYALLSKRILRILCLVLTYTPFLLVLANVAQQQELLGPLLVPTVESILLITLVLLPPAFLLMRLGAEDYSAKKQRPWLAGLVAFVPLVAALIISLAVDPFTENTPQHITITSRNIRSVPFFSVDKNFTLTDSNIEEEHVFQIDAHSDAPLGSFDISLPNYSLQMDSRDRVHTFSARDLPLRLQYSGRKQTFLGRSRYIVELSSRARAPREFSIDLYVGKDIPVYNSNFPYTFVAGSGKIQILIGKNPPNPLLLEFTLPADLFPRLEVNALYTVEDEYRLISGDDRIFTVNSQERIIFDALNQIQGTDNEVP